MPGIRSFIAIDVNDPELVNVIVGIQEEISRTSGRIKLVEKENLHLTLKFLGNVEEDRLERVKEVLERVISEFNAFKMRLVGIGAFPRIRRPNVVWIGVEEGREEFVRIASELDLALNKLGFPREKRGFEPHLTIARVKGSSGDLPSILERISDYEVGEFWVTEVRLKKSTLTPQGPIYETLHAVKLREVEDSR